MNPVLLTIELRGERDIVTARRGAREVSARLGFEPQDQARIATTVSELARNAIHYAGSGQVVFSVEDFADGDGMLRIEIADEGPGIKDVARAQAGLDAGAGEPKLGLVTARDCAAVGLSRSTVKSRLDSGLWVRVFRGVFKLGPGAPSSARLRC